MTTTTKRTFDNLAAAGLVAGPAVFALGDTLRRVVDHGAGSSPTRITAAVEAHPGLWLAAGLLELVAPLLTLPGIVALLLDAPARGRRTTVIGGLLVAVGQIAGVGHAVAYFAPFVLFAKAGTAAADIEAIDHASESAPMLVVLIALFMVGMIIGTIVLFVGLRRARRVPVWAVLAAVLFVALGGSAGVVPGALGVLAALVAFGAASAGLAGARGVRTVESVDPVAA